MNHERASASVMVAGLVLVAVLVGAIVGDVGVYLRARAAASAAADAAALAAAPVTFAPFGAVGSPAAEAARFATANGGALVSCVCPLDRTWRSREVAVVVVMPAHTMLFGTHAVPASSRAEFTPTALPGS